MRDAISINYCMYCQKPNETSPTWKSLLDHRYQTLKCEQCARKFCRMDETIDGVFCMFDFNEEMREYFHRLKFMKDVLLVYMFQQEIYDTLKKFQQTYPHHIITPIPMHEENKKIRTFAHVDELLRAAGVPFSHALRKITTETQSKKTRRQRLETKKLFETISDVKYKHFIVFDDIKTTGVTMKLAKEALIEAGAASVELIAFSGGNSKRPNQTTSFMKK